ncbi:MAG: hypothetical protein EAZ55_06950 [Cytophagales bacterium]|nr:MAG: hypothetical protein EAZ55_06950 [Cytophagales bacterium]
MASIKNIKHLSNEEINQELQNGAKFVIFEYAVSIIILTFKRGSNIYFIKAGESPLKYSLQYIIPTFIFGWWGIPWGPIYTIMALYTNFTGGKDVTQEVINSLRKQS